MTLKRSHFLAAICGLALVAAGCGGDDNDALSYDDTGTEISEICERVNSEAEGLTGQPQNDVPILKELVPNFEDAIQEVRDLEVNEELEGDRNAFADNGAEQVAIIKEAQAHAEAGDRKKYVETIEETSALDKESNEIASRLGATGCIE